MLTTRRSLLLMAGPAIALTPFVGKALSAPETSRLGPRTIGSPDAKVQVDEWLSLTCSHCAAFAETIFPQVKTHLIDTGKLRYRFHDFPLDQVALLGAMLARSLPADRYEPFVTTLLQTQNQWAFAQNIDPMQELRKKAAQFGISTEQFNQINADDTFRNAIITRQDHDNTFLKIPGTPYFRINDTVAPNAVSSYDVFAQAVEKAS